MKIIRDIDQMQELSRKLRCEHRRIGFVPTMGYFHDGHLSLMKIAREKADVVVVSIFVNPLQFGPREDIDRYPRDLEGDIHNAELSGVDIIFYPTEEEMYPEHYSTFVEVKELDRFLCGASRPGHFKGVVTVCSKLFNIVRPHFAVFGQKDAQQAFIMKRLVKDLNFGIEIIIAPIVREADGLAMSSRNAYLNAEQRAQAVCLFKSLRLAEELILVKKVKDPQEVISSMRNLINQIAPQGKIDYISIVDTKMLKPVDKMVDKLSGELLIALAVWIGKARLIDNVIVKV